METSTRNEFNGLGIITAPAAVGAPSDQSALAAGRVSRPRRTRPAKLGTNLGLPTDLNREKLVQTYLQQQHQLWPEMAAAGRLPSSDDPAILRSLSDDLERRHTTKTEEGSTSTTSSHGFEEMNRIAAAYLRYSCDNSNPRSLDDQLANILRFAKEKGLFVPWQLIYVDASVSGLDPTRVGYVSLKAALEHNQAVNLEAVLIDEFSRGGRDALEWFQFAAFCQNLHKNVLGASDSFDLNSPLGQVSLHVCTLFSSMFVTQLKEKVRRGMKGAAGRGTSVGRPPLGFGLVPKLDDRGNPVRGADGNTTQELALHEESMQHVITAGKWYGEQRWTKRAIAEEFRRLKVDGVDTWRICSIGRLLENPAYRGIFIFNRTHTEYDALTRARRAVQNPESEWVTIERPELRVFSEDLWQKIKVRLEASKKGPYNRRAVSRIEDAPDSPIRGALRCECGAPINKFSSNGPGALGCFNGRDGLKGCTMNTVKGVNIIEERLLEYVRQYLLEPDNLTRLVTEVNAAITAEAARPKPDIAPLRAQLSKASKRLKKLVEVFDGEESLPGLKALRDKIKDAQSEVDRLQKQVELAESEKLPAPPPLTTVEVTRYLSDLQGLLAMDAAVAGVALAKLTGPITVGHERIPGVKKGKWILRFRPSLHAALANVAKAGANRGNRKLDFVSGLLAPDEEVVLIVDKHP